MIYQSHSRKLGQTWKQENLLVMLRRGLFLILVTKFEWKDEFHIFCLVFPSTFTPNNTTCPCYQTSRILRQLAEATVSKETATPSFGSSPSGETPRCSLASWKMSSLPHVLGLPWELLLVAHAWNASPARRPGGIRNNWPQLLALLFLHPDRLAQRPHNWRGQTALFIAAYKRN